MRTTNKALILFAVAFILLPVGLVWAQGGFGIRPARQGIGYFTYSLKPGESVSDEVLVSNTGGVTITVKLYVVDAHTSQSGGSIYPGGEGTQNTGAGTWVEFPVSRAILGPGLGAKIPFTFTVPSDARPGEYVAGIVAQGTEPIKGEGQFAVNIVQRAVVPIWETVPGPVVVDFEIASVKHIFERGLSRFDVELHNTGNVRVGGVKGKLEVMDASGEVIGSLPIKMPFCFLAKDTVVYPVKFEEPLPEGRYSVAVTVDYGGEEPATWESTFEVTKEAAKKAEEEAIEKGFILPPRPAPERPNYWMYATVGLIVIVIAGGLTRLIRRRRSKGDGGDA